MGMYMRLTFWADLPRDSPAVPVIQRMIESGPQDNADLPEHALFRSSRAFSVLTCSSYYHRTGKTVFQYDDIARAWWLNIDSSLKNYGDEINLFLDWLSPYDTGDDEFRGFYQYEEDEHPTLIYREGDSYVFRSVAVT